MADATYHVNVTLAQLSAGMVTHSSTEISIINLFKQYGNPFTTGELYIGYTIDDAVKTHLPRPGTEQ